MTRRIPHVLGAALIAGILAATVVALIVPQPSQSQAARTAESLAAFDTVARCCSIVVDGCVSRPSSCWDCICSPLKAGRLSVLVAPFRGISRRSYQMPWLIR